MFDRRGDQAEGLRRMLGLERVRTIALLGARNRAGTTSCVMNLAVALGLAGRRVLIIDEHFGPANVSGLLGMAARTELKHLLGGECRLEQVLQKGPHGILVLPAANGARALGRLTPLQRDRATAELCVLDELCDVVLVDAVAPTLLQATVFAGAAQETVVVLEPDATSITQAYSRIKHLRRRHGTTHFRLLVNLATGVIGAQRACDNLAQAARGFLDATLEYAGTVPADPAMHLAAQQFAPVVVSDPASPAARSFQRMARVILEWPARQRGAGTPDALFHRVIQTSRPRAAGAGA